MPGDGLAVRADDDLGRADDLAGLHVGGTLDLADDGGEFLALFFERIQIGAEELDGELRFGAADQFVHGELNGLGHVDLHAGHPLQRFAHGVFDVLLGEAFAPGRPWA